MGKYRKAQTKKWYDKNKEAVLNRMKTYYLDNKEEINKRNTKWREAHPESFKVKYFQLFRMGEDGAVLGIYLRVSRKGNLTYFDAYTSKKTMQTTDKRNRKTNAAKINVRVKDNKWVHTNIPSSIWWHCEIHHDWKNGGIMYLLDPLRHSEITRRERIERRRKKNGIVKYKKYG